MSTNASGIITRVGEVQAATEICLQRYENGKIDTLAKALLQEVLLKKIRFPLLERCASLLFEAIPSNKQIDLCDAIAALKTMGGNVLIGIILQKRLPDHFDESMAKCREYIALGAEWYVCDIIGERVYGVSLLQNPASTLQILRELASDDDQWVARSIGPGCHYAIKKGLPKADVVSVFELLLSMARVKNKEVKQGVGWAAKTTAKFHPDIIARYRAQIDDTTQTGQWFRTKVRIGLERNAYAKRNRG